MKKRTFAIIAAVALVLLIVPTIAFANGVRQVWCPESDAEVLAAYASGTAGRGDAALPEPTASFARESRIDGADNAAQDNRTVGRGNCPGFIDEDGNGVCDVCESDRNACPGYIDADNDGVCDNYGSGACGQGIGGGCGHHGNGVGRHGCMNR